MAAYAGDAGLDAGQVGIADGAEAVGVYAGLLGGSRQYCGNLEIEIGILGVPGTVGRPSHMIRAPSPHIHPRRRPGPRG